ncbi:MAG: alanine racemase, partial [Pseudomonadota bacterium]
MDVYQQYEGGYRPTVTIDLGRLVGNFRRLAARQPSAEAAAVVKCDAYGLGLLPCARALVERGGCQTFFVAHPEEGARLRDGLADLAPEAEIFVLNGPTLASLPVFRAARLTPVVNSLRQARLWTDHHAGEPCGLHADVGIHRLGVPADEIDAALALPGLNATLFMGHLSCAGTPDDPTNDQELERFRMLADRAGKARLSLVSSGGALIGDAFGFDLIRLGVGLYGVSPFGEEVKEVKPVATLTAEVLQAQTVPAGGRVGYSGLFEAKRPTRLATLALGYGDGFPRAAPADGGAGSVNVVVGGAACPVVGCVSMDLVTVDVTEAPGDVAPGDQAEVFGDRMR